VEVYFTLQIGWSHLNLNCSLSTHNRCLGAPVATFAHNFCFILIKINLLQSQGRI